jgi:hypothetical protein
MTMLKDLTTEQLKCALAIKKQIEVLQGNLNSIEGGGESPVSAADAKPVKKTRRMSRAGRAAIAAGARARWAKIKGAEAMSDGE